MQNRQGWAACGYSVGAEGRMVADVEPELVAVAPPGNDLPATHNGMIPCAPTDKNELISVHLIALAAPNMSTSEHTLAMQATSR